MHILTNTWILSQKIKQASYLLVIIYGYSSKPKYNRIPKQPNYIESTMHIDLQAVYYNIEYSNIILYQVHMG